MAQRTSVPPQLRTVAGRLAYRPRYTEPGQPDKPKFVPDVDPIFCKSGSAVHKRQGRAKAREIADNWCEANPSTQGGSGGKTINIRDYVNTVYLTAPPSKAGYTAENTRKGYAAALRPFLLLRGDLALYPDITPDVVQDFVNYMGTLLGQPEPDEWYDWFYLPANERDAARAEARTRKVVFSKIEKFKIALGAVIRMAQIDDSPFPRDAPNPCHANITLPNRPHDEFEYDLLPLNSVEWREFQGELRTDALRILTWVHIQTMCRPSELRGLRVSDIDFADGYQRRPTITFRRRVVGEPPVVKPGLKGGHKSRTIELVPIRRTVGADTSALECTKLRDTLRSWIADNGLSGDDLVFPAYLIGTAAGRTYETKHDYAALPELTDEFRREHTDHQTLVNGEWVEHRLPCIHGSVSCYTNRSCRCPYCMKAQHDAQNARRPKTGWSPKHEYFGTNAYGDEIARACANAGIKWDAPASQPAPYTLRRTGATYMATYTGETAFAVADQLGHKVNGRSNPGQTAAYVKMIRETEHIPFLTPLEEIFPLHQED